MVKKRNDFEIIEFNGNNFATWKNALMIKLTGSSLADTLDKTTYKQFKKYPDLKERNYVLFSKKQNKTKQSWMKLKEGVRAYSQLPKTMRKQIDKFQKRNEKALGIVIDSLGPLIRPSIKPSIKFAYKAFRQIQKNWYSKNTANRAKLKRSWDNLKLEDTKENVLNFFTTCKEMRAELEELGHKMTDSVKSRKRWLKHSSRIWFFELS